MRCYLSARLYSATPYTGIPAIDTLMLEGRPATELFNPLDSYYLVTAPLQSRSAETWLVKKEYFESNFIETTGVQYEQLRKDIVCQKTL